MIETNLDPSVDQTIIESPRESLIPFGDQKRSLDIGTLLEEILKELRPQLPIQNPIPFFVHNNPLQFWEKYPFETGIEMSCLLYERTGIELDRSVRREIEDIVIPVVSSYLDQGMRRWSFSDLSEDQTLWRWFCNYVENSFGQKSDSFKKFKYDFKIWSQKSANQFICDYLQERLEGMDLKKEATFYIRSLLFHLKGWSGMIHLFESNPSLFPVIKKNISLLDWLAILVLVESRLQDADAADLLLFPPSSSLNTETLERRQRQIQNDLQSIKAQETDYYRPFIKSFNRHLNSLKISDFKMPKLTFSDQESGQEPEQNLLPIAQAPMAQVFFCIDDREESFRRLLEKVNKKIETFGTVGFFGVDIAIKGVDQLIFQPYCPPVIQPRKKVIEKSLQDLSSFSRLKKNFTTSVNHTRFTLYEPLMALFFPIIYFFALSMRTLNLGWYEKIKEKYFTSGKNSTDLYYEFLPGYAYTVAEKAKIVGDILKSAGLKTNFAPIVVMLGHGSSTTNNPFQKSYGCGACSGQSGYPNAKIFCSFANDPEIREELKSAGYEIPAETTFIAGHHDTCSDKLSMQEDVPLDSRQRACLEQLRADFQMALSENTIFRFNSFGMKFNQSAIQRSLDWSQPRPEYGHSKVALAVFGPRHLTAGINLDRRSFLVSYDAATDPEGTELEFVIMNALPVCANINLDYFTSRAFPEAIGSGSKLPMNIVSGIGLMTGSKSDLRIGLARQMVDQHQALRLLAFVCCKKEHLEKVVSKSARIGNLLKNEWIHLIRIDPVDFSMEAITNEISKDLADVVF